MYNDKDQWQTGILGFALFSVFFKYGDLNWTYNMVSKSFGNDEGFTAGLVFPGFIFWSILGFGSARYWSLWRSRGLCRLPGKG